MDTVAIPPLSVRDPKLVPLSMKFAVPLEVPVVEDLTVAVMVTDFLESWHVEIFPQASSQVLVHQPARNLFLAARCDTEKHCTILVQIVLE